MQKYTDQEFTEAIQNSKSIRQVLIKLGLAPKGGNYKTVHNKCNSLGLSMEHFTGQGYLKGETHDWANVFPMDQILVENSLYRGGSHKLRLRLIKEDFFEHKCYVCGLVEWLGKPIPLELEHINGQSDDNRIDNLTLLCPNCHAQTLTYRGKNKRLKAKRSI